MDQEDKKIIDAEAQKSDEPELLEKAATFGVAADVSNLRHTDIF